MKRMPVRFLFVVLAITCWVGLSVNTGSQILAQEGTLPTSGVILQISLEQPGVEQVDLDHLISEAEKLTSDPGILRSEPGFDPYVLEAIRVFEGWALLNYASYPSNADLAESVDLITPMLVLGIARQTNNGGWKIALRTQDLFYAWLDDVPSLLLEDSSKVILRSLMPTSQPAAVSAVQVPGLPYPVGQAWRYNQGPHPSWNTNSSLDFGTPTAGVSARVHAAETGVVVNTPNDTCLALQRGGDGLIIWYQHIEKSDIDDFGYGNTVTLGQSIGMTTLTPGAADKCGGTTSGHHVHITWQMQKNQPYNPEGSSFNGWVVVGNTLQKNGVTVQPNMVSTVLHSGGSGSCSAPTLISPASNATLSNRTITFSWNAVSGCTFQGYNFRVCSFSPVSNMFNCFVNEFVSGTQRTVTINNRDNMDLYWGVKAENAPNGASWAERKFRIDPGGPPVGETCTTNQKPAKDEVILFDEPNFIQGACVRLKVGEYKNLGDFGMNEKASSVRVGDDVDVILYKDTDFKGDDQKIEQDHVNLDTGSDVDKNEASSAKVVWENDDPGGSCGDPGPSQVALFDGEDFGNGEKGCIVLDVGPHPNFHDLDPDLNDAVSSLKVGDKVKVKLYEHSKYNEEKTGVSSSFGPGTEDEDLSDNTIKKNNASSAKVFYPLSSAPALADISNGDADGSFVVSWSSVQYAEHYDLYEQPPGGSWRTVVEDHPNLSFEFTGKTEGAWCYKVRAGHWAESSPESAVKCTTVNPPPAPPDTPPLLDISNPEGDGLYVVQWQAAARATVYNLQERFNGGNWELIYTGPELSTGRVDRAEGQWCYQVRASGPGGESPWSPEKCTTVAPPVAGAKMKVDPGSQTVSTSAEFCFQIAVEDATDVAAFEFALAYPPDLLEAKSATIGAFLGSTGRTVVPVGPNIDNALGLVTFGAATIGSDPAGPSGNGNLAQVCMMPKKAGVAALDLSQGVMTTRMGQSIPVALSDGSVTISSCFWADVNCDNKVDIIDIQLVAGRWGAKLGDPKYDPAYDIDDNDKIDIIDIQMVAGQWGWPSRSAQRTDTTAAPDATDAAAAPITLSLDPSQLNLAPGETKTFDLRVAGADDLASYQTTIDYNPALLKVNGVTFTNFLAGTGRTVVPLGPEIDNAAGTVSFGAFSFGEQPGVSGSGALATVSVTALATGSGPLNMHDSIATEPDATAIPVNETDGAFEVGDQECAPGPNGIILYSEPNYGGQCITLTAGRANLGAVNFNDKASSIRFFGDYFGKGWQVSLFQDTGYGGAFNNLRANDPNLADNVVGDDNLSSIRIWQDPDDGRPLNFGNPRAGAIDPPSDADQYYFDGVKGQVIALSMKNSGAGGLDSHLALANAQWVLLAQDNNSGGNKNARIQFVLPYTGRYRVTAKNGDGTSAGPYDLSLTIVANPPCTPGANGIVLYEHTNYTGWCITLTQSDASLVDNYFTNLASSVRFVGSYRNAGWQISLFDWQNYAGDFANFRGDDADLGNNKIKHDRTSSVRIWRDFDDNRTLNWGQPLNGTIQVPSDGDTYTFYGWAGQVVSISMIKTDDSLLNPYLMLYKPDWSYATADNNSGGGGNALINKYTLPVSGVYKVQARSNAYASAGNYQIVLTSQ